jgi:hypothetical protein
MFFYGVLYLVKSAHLPPQKGLSLQTPDRFCARPDAITLLVPYSSRSFFVSSVPICPQAPMMSILGIIAVLFVITNIYVIKLRILLFMRVNITFF